MPSGSNRKSSARPSVFVPLLEHALEPAGLGTDAAVPTSPATALNEALLIAGLRQHALTEAAESFNAELRHEIVERKRAQASLNEAKDRLANQAGELELLVAARTKELHATTNELEAFSYSVAHDMREPLRGMRGYAEILLAEHAAQLNPAGRGLLERIAHSAARMDALIQDVLNYTRVLRDQAPLETIDLDQLTREIIAIYPQWHPPQAEMEIIGHLPAVRGHGGMLTQCISNLLSNAVKFVRPGVTPKISIGAEAFLPQPGANFAPPTEGAAPVHPRIRLWIQDNGIGIAAKDRDRVFRMFERLNPRTQFEGTGIGLTIVRRSAERMGGRIDFESKPGEGTKFWLELDAAPT